MQGAHINDLETAEKQNALDAIKPDGEKTLKEAVPGKRELQKEVRRNAIIEAGLLEFTNQGFTATKLEDVAVRAGIGKGTIYLYFDSKESLFEEVVRKTLFPSLDQAAAVVAEFEGNASELLTRHLSGMYATMRGENMPQLVVMIMGETARFPKIAEFFFKEVIARGQEMLRTIVEKGVASGEFREDASKVYPQFLISPVIMSALWRLQFDQYDPIDLDDYMKSHIEFVLHSLKK